MLFSKTYPNFTLVNNETYQLTCIDTHGDTMEELIENAEVSIEDWNGDEVTGWTLGDLHQADYEYIVSQIMDEFVNYQAEYYSRGH